MSDLKALTSSGGGFGGGGGDDDDMQVPGNSKGVFFSGWMAKLGARTQRRGSLGFSDSHIGTPPSRLDDDSNSGFMEDKFSNGASPKRNGLSRKRNDSYSELNGMTPGDDGDLYFLRNKFRRNDSDHNLQDAAQSSIHITTDGMLRLDIAKSAEPHHETPMPGLGLPTLEEGKVLSISSETRYAHEQTGLKETPTARAFEVVSEKSKGKQIEDSEGSIFLIDLEELEESENGRKILKPQSKKFSASSILQSKFAQNWFFKNSDEDTDSLVTEEEDLSRQTSTTSTHSNDSGDSSSPNHPSDRSILTKLKTLVDKNPSKAKHREMNLWQPQGT